MTTHELAQQLLAMPNLPVYLPVKGDDGEVYFVDTEPHIDDAETMVALCETNDLARVVYGIMSEAE